MICQPLTCISHCGFLYVYIFPGAGTLGCLFPPRCAAAEGPPAPAGPDFPTIPDFSVEKSGKSGRGGGERVQHFYRLFLVEIQELWGVKNTSQLNEQPRRKQTMSPCKIHHL